MAAAGCRVGEDRQNVRMPTRLVSVVIDTPEPPRLGRWWADALGWRVEFENPDETDVTPPEGEPGIELTFVPVDDPKTVKNRIHLDLRNDSVEHQATEVERLVAAGAKQIDVGQSPDDPWVVLADPDGNEFCEVGPWSEAPETGAVAAIACETQNPALLAAFWSEATGRPARALPTGTYVLPAPDGRGPLLAFVAGSSPHTVKNRLHLDVAPFKQDDQAAEVERLIGLGATRADVGQSRRGNEVTWVVLADPEGNEFCVLSSRGE
jgi:hypothetical protein